ncbi:endonuclease/exonuclease/phosphatase family protein [Streptomyces sp. NPDC059455]|uniref:endonuclease/exonuclease/phosphatase family protein n=1 Tax=Streptomyces sp. NPDC059455 TaxID=3346837 RepID=UPI0036BE915F
MGAINVLCWNFERNGADDPAKRLRAHEKLASLKPHLILRQEMWGAEANGNTIIYELEGALGLRGWLGPKSCTAVFADPSVFRAVREWPDTGPMWVLPPAALTMRYVPAGNEATPLSVVSYHLNYASATHRLAEAEWLTTWADKRWPIPGDDNLTIPAILGGDNNGYPVRGAAGDPALPDMAKIRDRRHRLHRSYVGPDGRRQMDTRVDETLRTAGLEDVARYRATLPCGSATAVSRTVDGCSTHGPDARIDRIYVTTDLLAAVASVDVIEVPLDVSDHHIVRLRLDGDRLSDILNRQPVGIGATHGQLGEHVREGVPQ